MQEDIIERMMQKGGHYRREGDLEIGWMDDGQFREGEWSCFTVLVSLMEGDWPCYRGGQLMDGEWSCYRGGH